MPYIHIYKTIYIHPTILCNALPLLSLAQSMIRDVGVDQEMCYKIGRAFSIFLIIKFK